jgi:hypothetical protein
LLLLLLLFLCFGGCMWLPGSMERLTQPLLRHCYNHI